MSIPPFRVGWGVRGYAFAENFKEIGLFAFQVCQEFRFKFSPSSLNIAGGGYMTMQSDAFGVGCEIVLLGFGVPAAILDTCYSAEQ